MVVHWWTHAIIDLSKPLERTPPRVNLNGNGGLWVTMTCQCRFITFNKCPTLAQDADGVGNRGGHAYGGAGLCGESLYLPLHFAVNLKLL